VRSLRHSDAVARLLPPVTINGIRDRVHLGGSRGPRFLLRSDAGDLVGLYPRGAEPFSLYAAPLVPAANAADSLGRVDFFEDGGKLTVRS
jgi:hypothetical protein